MTLNILCASGKDGVQKRLSLSLFFLTWLFFFALFAEISWSASFLNAPHTEANGVYCIDCHEYSYDLWQGALPVDPTIDDTVKNFICLKCHSETGNAPPKAIHSSLIMAEQSHYPAWTTECIDCHDPHFQGQLSHFSTDSSELYLITGLVNSISHIGTDTVINYSAVTGKPGWLDPSKWNSKTGAGRGLIFVADALTPKDTFEILFADNFSITVSGLVNSSTVGNTFGIIYGQMIREQVLTVAGPKEVKFYDPNGGFTDTSATSSPTGICQVCHTQTLYWTSSGNNSLHNINTNCTGCHGAAQGFRVSYHDHSPTVTASVGCISCHNNPDIIGVYHLGSCITCHNSPRPEVIAAIASGSAECNTCHGTDFTVIHPDTINHTAIVTVGTTSCASCHSDPPPLVDAADSKVHNGCLSCHDANGALISLAIGKTAPGNCITCHTGDFTTTHPATVDHSLAVQNSIGCADCHTSTALVDLLDPTVHDACASCHDASGALTGSASGNLAPNECISCHTAGFGILHTYTHSGINTTQSCGTTGCHDFPDVVSDIHQNNCNVCHISTDPIVTEAVTAGQAECISCHTTGGHEMRYPYATCASCHLGKHDEWSWPPKSSGDKLHDKHINAKGITDCASCHGNTSPTCGGCHKHSSIASGPGGSLHNKHANKGNISCSDCHTQGDKGP